VNPLVRDVVRDLRCPLSGRRRRLLWACGGHEMLVWSCVLAGGALAPSTEVARRGGDSVTAGDRSGPTRWPPRPPPPGRSPQW